MVVFKGIFRHSIDEKGRISIPAKLRKDAGSDDFVITRGNGGCIALYTKGEWAETEERVRRLPKDDEETDRYIRTRIVPASDVTLDKQRRVIIPTYLLEYAKLDQETEAVVTGAFDKIEIWSNNAFEENQNTNSKA